MKFYSFIGLIVSISFLMLACNNENKDSLTIKGSLVNTDKITTLYPDAVKDGKITLLLYEIPFGGDQPVQLDSQTIPVSQTSFTLKGKTIGNAMFDIAVKDGPMIPLIDEGNDLEVEINLRTGKGFIVLRVPRQARLCATSYLTTAIKPNPSTMHQMLWIASRSLEAVILFCS